MSTRRWNVVGIFVCLLVLAPVGLVMKQPDLDEEALRLQIQGKDLVVLRQTMADNVPPVTVTSPSGATRELTLTASDPGTWRSTLPANELGLWQATVPCLVG